MWNIPTTLVTTAETSYRARILNLNLFNCFPSVPRPKYLSYYTPTGSTTLTIPAQNWNAYSFAAFLTESFKTTPSSLGETVATYDFSTNRYSFSPAIPLVFSMTESPTDAWKELGVKPSIYNNLTGSNTEVDFSGVTHIQVMSSWSAANLPITGKLATIPNDVYFTEELQFYEASGDPFLVVNQDITSITIELTDQNGTPLHEWLPDDENYTYPQWNLTILLDMFTEIERE